MKEVSLRLLNGIINKASKSDVENQIEQEPSCKSKKNVICPLILYTQILGLNHLCATGNRKKFLKIYNIAVVLVQIIITLRMFSLLRYIKSNSDGNLLSANIFNPSTALFITKLIFVSSGTLASILLFYNQNRLPLIVKTLMREHEEMDEAKQKYITHISFLMIFITFISSMFAGVSSVFVSLGLIRAPLIPSIINKEFPYVLIDGYAVFISQSAMILVAAIFCKFCNTIQCKTEKLIEDMVGNEEKDDECKVCVNVEVALEIVSRSQRRYQALQDANQMLESCFSFTLFYVYGCAVPSICFILYVILHDHDDPAKDPWEVLVFIVWMINVIVLLLCFSIPAFRVHEEGKRLITASFKMYHEHFCQQRDPFLLQAIQFFSFQVESARLTFTAGNFFTMDRSIILTLVSAILTYFIILIQLAQNNANCSNAAITH